MCWWVPPLHLIPRVLRHAQVCSSKGTLIGPVWTSAPLAAPLPQWGSFCHLLWNGCKYLTMKASSEMVKVAAVLFCHFLDSSMFMALFLDFS